MSIRNVVKVMNFHALIRVDNAKKSADKYKRAEEFLSSMMDSIMNNRNLILDKMIFKTNPDAPVLNIYVGSDFGFCSNYNSQVNEQLRKDEGVLKVVIGRKLHCPDEKFVIYKINHSELEERFEDIRTILEEAVLKQTCSKINIIYNHYENTTTIYFKKRQIFPIIREEGTETVYKEDFSIEGDAGMLMQQLICTYVRYELMLAIVNSRAAENVLRQNATTDSLKRIDEMEEEQVKQQRREKSEKEFQKVKDDFIKSKMY